MPNPLNIQTAFTDLINHAYRRYRGCLIECSGTGFVRNGSYYPTWEEVTATIDQSLSEWRFYRGIGYFRKGDKFGLQGNWFESEQSIQEHIDKNLNRKS